MARYTSKNTSVELTDSGAAFSVTLGPGEGDFSLDNIGFDNAEILNVTDRGVHDGLVEGDDFVQSWSITLRLRNQKLTHASQDRILDAIRKTNYWSTATSVDATRWAFPLIVTMNDGTTSTTITLPKCTAVASFAEGKDGHTVSLSGFNYVLPVLA